MRRFRELAAVLAGVAVVGVVVAVSLAPLPVMRRPAAHREDRIMWLKLMPAAPGGSAAVPAVGGAPAANRSPADVRRHEAGAQRLAAPPASPLFDAGGALLPAKVAETLPDNRAYYAYLADLRRRLQLAVAQEVKREAIPGVLPDILSKAALSLWISPTGQVARAVAPGPEHSGDRSQAAMQHVLVAAATSLDPLPPPPSGLPQPIEIGVEDAPPSLSSLKHFIKE
jgi:hypothetical protein